MFRSFNKAKHLLLFGTCYYAWFYPQNFISNDLNRPRPEINQSHYFDKQLKVFKMRLNPTYSMLEARAEILLLISPLKLHIWQVYTSF